MGHGVRRERNERRAVGKPAPLPGEAGAADHRVRGVAIIHVVVALSEGTHPSTSRVGDPLIQRPT
jgi:hypothetical protein